MNTRPPHDQSSCNLCIHAAEHGWWGDPYITHCRQCGDTWPLTSQAISHCVLCCHTFKSPAALDEHRNTRAPKVEECAVPSEIGQEPAVNEFGTGIWRTPFDRSSLGG